MLMLSGLGMTNAPAQETLDRPAVEQIIREYLLENPELLIEVQEALQKRQDEQLAEQQLQTIKDNEELIYSSPYQIEFGNPDAKVTIVEFFDYNCGFCQRALADMQQILESDNDVRFILKEFPVLGEASVGATRVSLAVSKILPEKYGEFHIRLLSMDGLKDAQRAMDLAVEMGADSSELAASLENPEIIDAITEIYTLADGLGITGTPSYVVGDNIVFGAVGYEQLKLAVNEHLAKSD